MPSRPIPNSTRAALPRLSRHLAGRLGFDAAACEKIEVAGLLHDIGKLQIPDEIIEGSAALTAQEFNVMKSHSYGTRQVLKRLHAIDEISRWASYHHETPDGRGYPFHVGGAALPLEARIINVADIFQALAQQRPYREPLAPGEDPRHPAPARRARAGRREGGRGDCRRSRQLPSHRALSGA